MAADSATAEKLDLVSRKSANATGLEAAATSPAREEVESKIEKLQETIDQIRTTTRTLTEAQTPPQTPTPPVQNNSPAAAANVRPAAFVRPASAKPSGTPNPFATATIRPKMAPQPQPAKGPTSFSPRAAAPGPNARPRPNPQSQSQRSQQQPPANTSMPVPLSDVQRWKNYRSPKLSMPAWQKYLPDVGIVATGAWMTGAVLYLGGIVGWDNLASMPAHHLGSVIAGIAAPIALMWMGIHYSRRDRDIKEQMAPLLHQMDQLMNPNKQIEARIEAVSDALRRQANELINAANQVEKTLGNVREGLRSDMEKMMEYAGLTGKHLEQASTAMSNRTSHLARLTEQMHGRLVSFEEHAKTGSDRLDQSINDMMSRAQTATDKLERQSNNIVAALHAANMRMTRTADDLDSRIGQVANFADQTAARFGDIAAEFGRNGAVVDAATNTMEVQMLRMHDMLSQQMAEMAQTVGAFGTIGRDLSGAVTHFRGMAEQLVGAAVNQIQNHTDAMDQRLAAAAGMLDRSAAIALTGMRNMDQSIEEKLYEMQNKLRDAAAETPRLVQAIMDDTSRRLVEMDARFSQSGNVVASQLSDLERHIGARLEAMSALAHRMSDGASETIKESVMSVFAQLEELKLQFVDRASGTQRDLKTFHNDLAQTIESLAHVARRSTDRTVERILTMNAGISQRIMDLRDTAETAAAQGKQLEGTMAQHIGMLREANDTVSHQMARMQMYGAQITNDLRDATGQAMAQAEVLSHMISREADTLRDMSAISSDQMETAAAKMETARQSIYNSVSSAAQQVAIIVKELDEQRVSLTQTHNDSAQTHAALYDEVMRLRDATSQMNAQVNSTLMSTDERAYELRILASRLDEVTMAMESSMRRSEMTLSNSANLVEQVGVEARDMMVRSGQEMVEASELMLRELRGATMQAMAQAEVLSHVITREADSLHQASVVSAQTLDNATAAIEASRAELYATVAATAEQVLQSAQRLDNQRLELEETGATTAQTYNKLYRETNELCDAIVSLNAQVENTAIASDERADELRSLIGRLGETTYEIQSAMESGVRSLDNSTDQMMRSNEAMTNISARIANELSAATERAMAQAEVLEHVIGRQADSLMKVSELADAQLEKTSGMVKDSRNELYAAVTDTISQVKEMTEGLDQQRKLLEGTQHKNAESHSQVYAEVLRLNEATAALAAQANSTVSSAGEHADELRNVITRLGEVTMGMKAVLQSGQYNLMDSAEMISKVTTEARDVMVSSSRDIAAASSEIAQNTGSIAVSFQQQKDALQDNMNTGVEALETMVQKLQGSANSIMLASESSARDIDWLCSNIISAGEAIDQMGTRAQDAMSRAREMLIISEASLQRSASSARINLSELSERYLNEGDRLNAVQGNIHTAYDQAMTRLERLGQELAAQSFYAFDSVSEVGMALDARIAQLRDGGAGAVDQLQRVTNELQQNYVSLTQVTENAAQQLAEIQSGLTMVQSDVSLSTNHASEQVDAVRRKLGVYAQDMMMMVSQASGQIEAAAGSFNDRAIAMMNSANENATQLGDMGARVRMEIEQLAKTVKEATSDQAGALSSAVERLRHQAEELARQSQQSMVELERQGIRTTENMRQINQGAEEASAKLRETSQQLMRQTENVSMAGSDVAKRISQATQQMQMQTQAIRTGTDKAVAVMNETGEELAKNLGQFQAVAQKTQMQVRQMLDNMAQQMTQMDVMSSKAEESATRVTQADTRIKRDAFLNAAKFVIESLNSLAIDLTRVLDPQEADKVWKEFAKGDASAFTRRFLQMREDVPIQRLKEKYERDGEFRTYVMRYFRQFEELFQQALNNDHNDLLATTLTTSDVGKLYSYLAGALGHSQLKAVNSNKAA